MEVKKESFFTKRNPEYLENSEKWGRFRAAYDGGVEYAQSVLIQHSRESKAQFEKRKNRAVCPNYCESVVDIRTAFLMKDPPSIKVPSNFPQKFLSDVDRQGTSLESFIEEISTQSQILGAYCVMADYPRVLEPMISRQQEISLNLRPYLISFSPENLLNWGRDENGDFTFALIKQEEKSQVLEFTGSNPKLSENNNPEYVLWTKNQIAFYDSEGRLSGEPIENTLGFVPLVIIKYKKDRKKTFGKSILNDIEPLQRYLVNLYSIIGANLFDQSFSQLVIEGKLFGKTTLDETTGKMIEIPLTLSTESVLEYTPETKPPAFIAPSSGPNQDIRSERDHLLQEIHRMGSLKKGALDEGVDRSSGYSKAMDFVDTNQSLGKQSRNIADGIENALWYMQCWIDPNSKREDFSCEFPRDFGIDDSLSILSELQQILMTDAPPDVIELYLLKIINLRFPELDGKEKNRIVRSIKDYFTGDGSNRGFRGEEAPAENQKKSNSEPQNPPINQQ